jgi:hypothetical protein
MTLQGFVVTVHVTVGVDAGRREDLPALCGGVDQAASWLAYNSGRNRKVRRPLCELPSAANGATIRLVQAVTQRP